MVACVTSVQSRQGRTCRYLEPEPEIESKGVSDLKVLEHARKCSGQPTLAKDSSRGRPRHSVVPWGLLPELGCEHSRCCGFDLRPARIRPRRNWLHSIDDHDESTHYECDTRPLLCAGKLPTGESQSKEGHLTPSAFGCLRLRRQRPERIDQEFPQGL